MCDHAKFAVFYGNNENKKTCHGNSKMGDSYICPAPSIGGLMAAKPKKQPNYECGVPVPNMGRLAYCPQTGGGSGSNLMYSATGNLGKNKGCGCQTGGGHKSKAPKQKQNSEYPQSTCECRNSSKCSYMHYNGTRQYDQKGAEVTGYYPDLTAAPIGNRPAYGVHDNDKYTPNTMDPTKDQGNLLDRQFDCQQPFWHEKCL